jgi:hypothetical protein
MKTITENNEYSASNAISVTLIVNIHVIHFVLCIVLFLSRRNISPLFFSLLFIPKWYITWLFSFHHHSWWCVPDKDTKARIFPLFISLWNKYLIKCYLQQLSLCFLIYFLLLYLLKKFIKIFRTNKNHFWVLSTRFSYLSQNSSLKSKNLFLYLKLIALQNGNILV